MAEVGSRASSSGVLLYNWLDKDSNKLLSNETKSEKHKEERKFDSGGTDAVLLERNTTFWTSPQIN